MPEVLERRKGKVDHAIWGASITDISNLKKMYLNAVNKPNTDKWANEEKAAVYKSAARSSLNSIQVAEAALQSNPSIKKIIVTDRPARYDEMYEVNEYSNFVLRCRALQSAYKARLVVGEHSLHCKGAVREARYGKAGVTKGFDGVHFRTVEGKEAFTKSLIRILKKEEVGSVMETTSEWEVAGGRRAARRLEAEVPMAGVPTTNQFSPLN